MTNREKGAAARAEANRRAAELATYAAAPYTIAKALARGPTEQAIGFLTGKAEPDAANAETATPQRRSLGKGSKPASVAPSAADAAAQFVDDRTRPLPRGLSRYSGSDLGAAVYEGRTVDGTRYFTNRPFENLDGAFEFKLDRSAPAKGLAGRTYPEFSQGDVMPAISEADLRDLSPMQRERFDEAQTEAARGAEYQNAPILAERDEQLQRSGKAQAEMLAEMTPGQRGTYMSSIAKQQADVANQNADNVRADATEKRRAEEAANTARLAAEKNKQEQLRYDREQALANPTDFINTTKLNTSDAGIEALLNEEASAPTRDALSGLLRILADDATDGDPYSQASLLRDITIDDDDKLALKDPNSWGWDEEWTLDPSKLPTSNPDVEEVLRKLAMRNKSREPR